MPLLMIFSRLSLREKRVAVICSARGKNTSLQGTTNRYGVLLSVLALYC